MPLLVHNNKPLNSLLLKYIINLLTRNLNFLNIRILVLLLKELLDLPSNLVPRLILPQDGGQCLGHPDIEVSHLHIVVEDYQVDFLEDAPGGG